MEALEVLDEDMVAGLEEMDDEDLEEDVAGILDASNGESGVVVDKLFCKEIREYAQGIELGRFDG